MFGGFDLLMSSLGFSGCLYHGFVLAFGIFR